MSKNLEAVAEAMTCLGTPYHHQGRVKGVGVDCGTLICEVYGKNRVAANMFWYGSIVQNTFKYFTIENFTPCGFYTVLLDF